MPNAINNLKQVWDYQTKSCVQTLEGHTHNVSAVCFHPELPIILTGSEDGTVRIWHSTTYRYILYLTLDCEIKLRSYLCLQLFFAFCLMMMV